MTTRFGKWLETEGFAKCFNVVILLAIGLDTLMTGLAGWQRCQSSIWTGVLGAMTFILGMIVYTQKWITERWPQPKVDIFVGFVSSYLIYRWV